MSEFRYSPKHPRIDEKRLDSVIAEMYESEKFFGRPFLDIYKASLDATKAGINPFQAMNKLRRCINLCRLYLMASKVKGDLAECGVFRGSTSRLVVEVMLAGGIKTGGREFLLFDSFEGLPDAAVQDAEGGDLVHGKEKDDFHLRSTRRFSNTSAEAVAAVFKSWPWISIRKGWMPDVFKGFEDRRYSFAHIDVDLYRSTYDCLEYLVPRMNPGGIIVCDDYLSLRFPGARKAWDEYCDRHNVPFVTLDNYQSAIIAE